MSIYGIQEPGRLIVKRSLELLIKKHHEFEEAMSEGELSEAEKLLGHFSLPHREVLAAEKKLRKAGLKF